MGLITSKRSVLSLGGKDDDIATLKMGAGFSGRADVAQGSGKRDVAEVEGLDNAIWEFFIADEI